MKPSSVFVSKIRIVPRKEPDRRKRERAGRVARGEGSTKGFSTLFQIKESL